MTNLFKTSWSEVDPSEIRLILLEHIGKPGQYRDRANNPWKFYLPLADSSCRLELTFSEEKNLIAIERGPAFDAAQWDRIVREIESTSPNKFGRDISFSSFHVSGSWQGPRSGVQILPPPADAPVAPCERAEHPFIVEYPLKVSEVWSITNYRRTRDHRRLTLLLNILLAGRTCVQPRRFRHLWATVRDDTASEVKWVQEFYFANFGEAVMETPSPLGKDRLNELPSEIYYTSVAHDGRCLEVPSDLDNLICCYKQLSANNRATFDRGSFWMDMASRQWTISLSASFASLVIAIEALGNRKTNPRKRFYDYLETYAPGASLQEGRKKMYDLRCHILHGSGLMEMDRDGDFGWSPAEQEDKDLMEELWGLTKLSMRNWLQNPPS